MELTCAIQLRMDIDTDIEKKAEKNIHSSSDNTKHENHQGKHPFQVTNRQVIHYQMLGEMKLDCLIKRVTLKSEHVLQMSD